MTWRTHTHTTYSNYNDWCRFNLIRFIETNNNTHVINHTHTHTDMYILYIYIYTWLCLWLYIYEYIYIYICVCYYIIYIWLYYIYMMYIYAHVHALWPIYADINVHASMMTPPRSTLAAFFFLKGAKLRPSSSSTRWSMGDARLAWMGQDGPGWTRDED